MVDEVLLLVELVVSLLATLGEVEEVLLVLPVAWVDEVSLLAKPLVLPVWLRELLELVDGEVVAAPEVLVEDVSLLATELLLEDGDVLVEELEVPLLLAKPLVLPVALSELLDVLDGDVDAMPLLLADEDVSLLATEPLAEPDAFTFTLVFAFVFCVELLAYPELVDGVLVDAEVLLFIELESVLLVPAEDGELLLLEP